MSLMLESLVAKGFFEDKQGYKIGPYFKICRAPLCAPLRWAPGVIHKF